MSNMVLIILCGIAVFLCCLLVAFNNFGDDE